MPIGNRRDFARRADFAVPPEGTTSTGIVHCDQPLRSRSCRKWAEGRETPAEVLENVLARATTIFA